MMWQTPLLLRIARRVYHALPSRLRYGLIPFAGLMLQLLVRPEKAAALPAPSGEGVTVAGLFSSPTGIGEGARLCADALEQLGLRVERLDLAPALGQDVPALRRPPDPPLARGPIILHLNPPLFRNALAMIKHRRRRRMVIGYWAWELESVPDHWRDATSGVQEIWTPSRFSAAALRRTVQVAVRVVPHPVVPRQIAANRTQLGLPEDTCIFLCFANLHSNLARKNPLAALQAYACAFPIQRLDVLLMIKLDGEDVAPAMAAELRRLATVCPCPVRFVTGTLEQATRDTLIASADVLVSLHRSEGFGLTMAEAMALGVPVIATAWSGNLDFTLPGQAALVPAALVPVSDPQGFYAQDLHWAEPNIDEAASWFRRLAESPALRREMAAASARTDLSELFRAALPQTALPIASIPLPAMLPFPVPAAMPQPA